MKATLRNKWIGAGILGLLIVSSFAVFSSQAHAQTTGPRTHPPTDTEYRGGGAGTASTENGRECRTYLRIGEGTRIVDCTNPDQTIETCEIRANGTEGVLPTTTVCDIWRADGTFVRQGTITDRLGSDTAVTTTNPATGEQTTTITGPVSSTVSGIASVLSCVLGGPISCLVNTISYMILQFANLLLALAGSLFNWVIVKTVFQFATFLGNSPGVLIAWGVLRDIGNMLLLFGFIFIGLATILDLHTYAAKKALPRLIIFAVLMNFSLFAAEAVIDVSNVISVVMNTQASAGSECAYSADAQNVGTTVADSQAALKSTDSNANCFLNSGIASRLMHATGADSGLFSVPIGNTSSYENAVGLLMLALFATVAAVVLFAGSIMLIVRAVTLTLLMIVAPLGFAGMAVPALNKMGMDWWNRLLHQAFFAPIFLLLIFVSLKISESFSAAGSLSLAGAVQNLNPSAMGIILVFGLMIGFLIASLIAAKKFGAAGATFAVKAATGVTAGTMGWAGRNSAGWAGSRAGAAVQKRYGDTWAGGIAARGLSKVGTRSFDFRASTGATAVAKAAGLDIGKVGKDAAKGYEGVQKAKAKVHTDYAETLEMSDDEKQKDKTYKAEQSRIQNAQNKERNPLTAAETELNINQARQKQLDENITDATARESAATISGDAAALAAATADLAAANAELAARKADEARLNTAVDTAKADFDEKNKLFQPRLEELKKLIEENDPKVRYAQDLLKTNASSPVRPLSLPGTASRTKAAKTIMKNASKSEDQKIKEAITKMTTPPPPPAPPSP